jgi:hypothetical protein
MLLPTYSSRREASGELGYRLVAVRDDAMVKVSLKIA